MGVRKNTEATVQIDLQDQMEKRTHQLPLSAPPLSHHLGPKDFKKWVEMNKGKFSHQRLSSSFKVSKEHCTPHPGPPVGLSLHKVPCPIRS